MADTPGNAFPARVEYRPRKRRERENVAAATIVVVVVVASADKTALNLAPEARCVDSATRGSDNASSHFPAVSLGV